MLRPEICRSFGLLLTVLGVIQLGTGLDIGEFQIPLYSIEFRVGHEPVNHP